MFNEENPGLCASCSKIACALHLTGGGQPLGWRGQVLDHHLGGASGEAGGEADMFESLADSKQAYAHKSGMARMVR